MKQNLIIFGIIALIILFVYREPVLIEEVPVVVPEAVVVTKQEPEIRIVEVPVTGLPEIEEEVDTQALAKLQEQLEQISNIVSDLEAGIEAKEEKVIETNLPVEGSFEQQAAFFIHEFTNAERKKAGLSGLDYDVRLAQVAQLHSEDMAARDYFEHVSPENCNLTCRLNAVEYSASTWGENIAWQQSSSMPSAQTLAESFVRGWMDSPGHRENILRSAFTHEGVGVVIIGDQIYATVNFSKPR